MTGHYVRESMRILRLSAGEAASLLWVSVDTACSVCCSLREYSYGSGNVCPDSYRQIGSAVLSAICYGVGTYGTPEAHTFTLKKIKFGNETARLPCVHFRSRATAFALGGVALRLL